MVKAWAERPESSDEEEESGSDQPRHSKNKNKSFARKFTKRVKSATRKDDSDGGKPRRRSIFTRAMPFIGGSLNDLDNYSHDKKDTDKPRRRSLFVRAKPLDSGTVSDTEGYTKEKDKKYRRRSLFERAKLPVSDVLSDTETHTTDFKKLKKEKEKSDKPKRGNLFARGKASTGGSYSDTEGDPETKKDELKPRRRSLFVRPKSASSVPFFENKGFSPDKKLVESPRTSTTEISNPVAETDGDEQQPKSTEVKPSTDRVDPRDDNKPSDVRLTNGDTPSAKRVDPEKLVHFRPGNKLKPLNVKSTTNEDIASIENDNFLQLKDSQDIIKTQHKLKPINIKQPPSDDEATDDENHRKESDSSPNIIPQKRLLNTSRPISEDESTDEENKTKVSDVIPRATQQDMLKHNLVLDMRRPISEDEATDDENQPRKNYENTKKVIDQNRLKPTDIPQQQTDDEATDDESNPNKPENKSKVNRQRVMELILRGTARAVGRLQHRAKMPKFNFEKYISYLQNVLPTIGFKIMGITVTWEMVSTLLFLEVSLLALFMQESIFGNQQAKVAL